MKVAIIGTRGIPPRYGGFETFAWHLSKGLAKRGHHVTVYGRKHTVGDEPLPEGVESVLTDTLRFKHGETLSGSMLASLDACKRDFDVALVCNVANAPFVPFLKDAGMAVALNVDGIEHQRLKWGKIARFYLRWCEKVALSTADALVSDAEVIHRYYKETYGKDSEIIAYGVEPLEPKIDETGELSKYDLQRDGYFLYTARLEPENMAHVAIQAHHAANCHRPLVVVGDAPYASGYINRLKDKNRGNVLFLGGIYGKEYRLLKSNCFAYIQAGEVGGTHPALLEGMAWAPVVVANDVPEHREVGEDTILYYEKNHVGCLGRILYRLEESKEQREIFSFKARKRISDHYRWEEICTQYEKLFSRICAKSR